MKNRCYNFPNLRWLHQAACFSHQHTNDVQDTVYYHVRRGRAEHNRVRKRKKRFGSFCKFLAGKKKTTLCCPVVTTLKLLYFVRFTLKTDFVMFCKESWFWLKYVRYFRDVKRREVEVWRWPALPGVMLTCDWSRRGNVRYFMSVTWRRGENRSLWWVLSSLRGSTEFKHTHSTHDVAC